MDFVPKGITTDSTAEIILTVGDTSNIDSSTNFLGYLEAGKTFSAINLSVIYIHVFPLSSSSSYEDAKFFMLDFGM